MRGAAQAQIYWPAHAFVRGVRAEARSTLQVPQSPLLPATPILCRIWPLAIRKEEYRNTCAHLGLSEQLQLLSRAGVKLGLFLSAHQQTMAKLLLLLSAWAFTSPGPANLPGALNTPKQISIEVDFCLSISQAFGGPYNWDFTVQKLLEKILAFAHIFVGALIIYLSSYFLTSLTKL